MNNMESKLISDAQALLPVVSRDQFNHQFRELLGNTIDRDWTVKLLKLFEMTADSDKLTEMLFTYWDRYSKKKVLSFAFHFVSDAYKLLDKSNYIHFLRLILEYIDEGCNQEKQVIGRRMIEILRQRADMIHGNDSSQENGASAQFEAFLKFQLLFEMFISLDSKRYVKLVLLMNKINVCSDANIIEYVRKIASELFGKDETDLANRFLYFFTQVKVNSPPSEVCNQNPISASLVVQNYPFPNPQSVDNPSQVLMAPAGQRYPVLDPSIQDYSTTMVPDHILFEPNYQVLNTQLPNNQPPLLVGPSSYSDFDRLKQISVDQKKSAQNPHTMVLSSMDSAAQVESNPPLESWIADYTSPVSVNPVTTPTRNPTPIEPSSPLIGDFLSRLPLKDSDEWDFEMLDSHTSVPYPGELVRTMEL